MSATRTLSSCILTFIYRYLQTNRTEPVYKGMHEMAMGGIKEHLLKVSATKGLMYTSELLPRRNLKAGTL